MNTKLGKFFKNFTSQKNILLFDFNNLIYRMLFVARNEIKKHNEEYELGMRDKRKDDQDIYIYCRYLIVNSFLNTIKSFSPDRVIFAIDNKNNWRRQIYSEYKLNRITNKEKDDFDWSSFFVFLDNFIDNIRKIFTNIYIIKVDNSEADDIIAVICKLEKSNLLTILSSDKDYIQLQKNKNVKQYDPKESKEILSLNPQNDLYIKILMGDKGDNIPAVKERVGIKTAEKILNEGLEEFLKDEVILQNYKRNTQLIDFDYIPYNIEQSIKNIYEIYEIKELNGSNVYQFLLNNRLNKLADDWQIYSSYIKKLS